MRDLCSLLRPKLQSFNARCETPLASTCILRPSLCVSFIHPHTISSSPVAGSHDSLATHISGIKFSISQPNPMPTGVDLQALAFSVFKKAHSSPARQCASSAHRRKHRHCSPKPFPSSERPPTGEGTDGQGGKESPLANDESVSQASGGDARPSSLSLSSV